VSADSLILRDARIGEAEDLAALKLETFREGFVEGGFAIPYPPVDLAMFEAASYSPAKVAAELADCEHKTWIVEAAGRMLGYAHVGPCKLPHPEVAPGAAELYQLYVRGEAQGLGIGRRLLTHALDHLAHSRPGPVWLGVWSGNHRAQALYAARGFAKVGEYRFPVGSWEDEEFIFRRD
jgi:ribosomal protein S18 acetylase RimI-like enzyme